MKKNETSPLNVCSGSDQEVLSSALGYNFNLNVSKLLCPVEHSLLTCPSEGCNLNFLSAAMYIDVIWSRK